VQESRGQDGSDARAWDARKRTWRRKVDKSERLKTAREIADDPSVHPKTRMEFGRLAAKMEVTEGLRAAMERKRIRIAEGSLRPGEMV